MIRKGILFGKLVGYTVSVYIDYIRRTRAVGKGSATNVGEDSGVEPTNIVIIGASFAGYHAARLIASALPPDGTYRIVIIEPSQHFQFTWTLPRFCVIEGHEHKTFIPYGPYLPPGSEKSVRWVHARVSTVGPKSVTIQGTGEEIPFGYLVIASGSGAGDQLPSRVGAAGKADGVALLQDMQRRIKAAKKLVVVGGGAAGVELATDAKNQYPDKSIVLVHSRDAVMHRFGPELQAAALKGLEVLGVEVLLGERTVSEDADAGIVTLRSGKKLDCDLIVNCTGQRPASSILSSLAPKTILESGHIRVKPTLQIDDDSLPNIYACGDVAKAGNRNANSRAAMKQAAIAADNITLAFQGKQPSHIYKPHWADGVIKLTLGLEPSITHFGDGKTELLFHGKEKDITLMIESTWRHMGATPFEDKGAETQPAHETGTDKAKEIANDIV